MKNGKDRQVVTIIGPGTSFEGDLISEEGLRIDGSLKGRIECQSTLVISRTARVQADIIGDDVLVAGEIRGTVTGKNIVEVSSGGRIIGDITTANLVMEPGAFFEGKCNMNHHANDPQLLNHEPLPEQPSAFADVHATA